MDDKSNFDIDECEKDVFRHIDLIDIKKFLELDGFEKNKFLLARVNCHLINCQMCREKITKYITA